MSVLSLSLSLLGLSGVCPGPLILRTVLQLAWGLVAMSYVHAWLLAIDRYAFRSNPSTRAKERKDILRPRC